MSQTAMRFRDENRRPTGCRGLAPRSPFLRIASRALQSAGRGRFASALPAEYHSRLGAIILRYAITRLSHAHQPSSTPPRITSRCSSASSSASRGGNRRRSRRPVDRCCYLPREVFFGRLGFAGAFFTVWASDFGRFLPAMSDSFPVDCSQAHPTGVAPRAVVGFLLRGQRWFTPICWRPFGATAWYER